MGKGKVFVIEDDFTRKVALSDLLEKEGFEVVRGGGEGVLDQLSAAKPGVIITDVDRVSPAGPTHLLEEIKSREELKNVEIFVYTSALDVSLEVKLRKLKLINYFTKNANTDFLLQSIHGFFSGRAEENLIEIHRVDGPRNEAPRREEDDTANIYPPPEYITPKGQAVGEQTAEQVGEMLGEFSEKVHRQLGGKDGETYYNLGISYMDMGLYNEALKEFQHAAGDEQFRLEALSMSGRCLREMKKYKESVEALMAGMKIAKDPVEQMGFRYEIGVTLQEVGKLKEAFNFLASVYKADKTYRDVAKRLVEIKARAGADKGQNGG